MGANNLDPKIVKKLGDLEKKYDVMGQDLSSYLDGLLHADYLTYWDYINLDTLLTLQQPKTSFPDETIFITYHQITELYFKLVLWELNQICKDPHESSIFSERLSRMNRYFEQLAGSFEVMVEGMSKKQFLNFRMSLLPSSGFQSAQYRFIEIGCTDLINLVSVRHRDNHRKEINSEKLYEVIYWKDGASELATGEKTLTLKQFEKKYRNELIQRIGYHTNNNLCSIYLQNHQNSAHHDDIRRNLRKLDQLVNVHWPLAHYKSAAKHLQNDPDVIAATGGTNWQKYLPPRFQKVIFFPELWSKTEIEEWGKSWVKEVVESSFQPK